MDSFEKLGQFYLGKLFDLNAGSRLDDYLMYDSRDLVTHSVVVGMTGSGKTGLGIGILEEAAIDNIPAIVIDPKGDLGNLLLTFPGLAPGDFLPWVSEDEAARKSISVDQYAAEQAEAWRKGLLEWGQTADRIARLRESAEFDIYTPGSTAGLPVSILNSFSAPPRTSSVDMDLLRERIVTTVSGLLGLIGIDADPLQSREHILLSNLLESAWTTGRDLDLAQLIQMVQAPPIARIGVFDLDSFYPSNERLRLAMQLNNLLAAPAFSAWMEGDSLDVDRFLYTPAGKPRISIFSIAHLSDAERMFFVTLLLNQVLGWMRAQPGTSSLRALLYMDEMFGFLPPVAQPPSKRALLTLLKQARAFGLGLVLATQNPVDLDYKALANAGTWFIGRLQTEQDKDRLLAGLTTAAASSGRGMDSARYADLLSRLAKRVFLMHNVNRPEPALFQTRWTLSYLRGPMTRSQIKQLMDPRKEASSGDQARSPLPDAMGVGPSTPGPAPAQPGPFVTSGTPASAARPSLPSQWQEFFAPVRSAGGAEAYRAHLFAAARVHIIDSRTGIGQARDLAHALQLEENNASLIWDQAPAVEMELDALAPLPLPGVAFAPVPLDLLSRIRPADVERTYRDYLFRASEIRVWKSNVFKMTSQPGESERDFRIRLTQLFRERRDFELDQLRRKYAGRLDALARQEAQALADVERQSQQYEQQKMQTMISVGSSVLGALFGSSRRSGTIGRATTAARGAGRMSRERQDIGRAEERLEETRQKRRMLEDEMQAAVQSVSGGLDPQTEMLQEILVRPKKNDILIRAWGVLWVAG